MSCPEDLVAHMRRVLVAERDLHDLGMTWRWIESSAAISCPREVAPILPTLEGTRIRFESMQARLIAQMADETLAQLSDDLGAKARCAIDILVRNLYERTADVGFLATDERVRAFCAAPLTQRQTEQAAMQARLCEYQRKYSVYDDIVLCSPGGDILLRLSGDAAPHTQDPIVAEALAAPAHVERFGPSDLAAPGEPATLCYAHRIQSPQGAVLGVLVLRFRFADEMLRLFAEAGGRQQVALMLLDPADRVIASNDEDHVPLGVHLACAEVGGVQLINFAGREYLGLACRGTPYQGYPGPAGWRAVAMVSLLTAFSARAAEGGQEDTVQVAMAHAELLAIRDDADAINRDLRRVVWNGRLMARGEHDDRLRLNAVLRQVAEAGVRTRARVERAIQDIGQTALARGRQRAQELGRLMSDILDRNLYERANDCRWWALSPVLRQALAQDEREAARPAMTAVLEHINRLYTVYSRLVVFDAQGVIQAHSGEAPPGALVGQTVPEALRRQVQALSSSQAYAVTAFEDTPWHAHGPTYTYLAAVRDPADERRIVGGIAIVFHAERELCAILQDILGDRPGLAAFVDAQGRVLAHAGAVAPVPALTGFEGDQAIVAHGDTQLLCARVTGRGYREFRQTDGYDHGVQVVVGLKLGPVERRRRAYNDAALKPPTLRADSRSQELAIFQVGAGCYALPTQALVEARTPQGLVSPPQGQEARMGLLEVEGAAGACLIHVLCARRLFGVPYAPRAGDGTVLVLRHPVQADQPVLGLKADDVLSVVDVDPRDLGQAPAGFRHFAPWVTHLLRCDTAWGEPLLVQLLSPEVLLAQAGLDLGRADADGLADPAPASAGVLAWA